MVVDRFGTEPPGRLSREPGGLHLPSRLRWRELADLVAIDRAGIDLVEAQLAEGRDQVMLDDRALGSELGGLVQRGLVAEELLGELRERRCFTGLVLLGFLLVRLLEELLPELSLVALSPPLGLDRRDPPDGLPGAVGVCVLDVDHPLLNGTDWALGDRGGNP